MSSETSRRYEAWNELCDADALWGPFVFLRPAPDRAFSRLRLLLVVTLFGSFYGLCGTLLLAVIHHLAHWPVPPLAVLPLTVIATAFVCGEVTFLRAWNERARLMVRREAWLERQGTTRGSRTSSLEEQSGD